MRLQPISRVVASPGASWVNGPSTSNSTRWSPGAAARIADGDVRVTLGERAEAVEPSRRPTRTFSRRSLFRRPDTVQQATQVGASTGTDATPRELLLAAVPQPTLSLPRIDEGCTGCAACVRTCPAGAITTQPGQGGLALLLDARRCVGCGDCARLCPEAVITLERGVALPEPVQLITVADRACSRCGRSLSAGEDQNCTPCATRGSLAAEALSQLLG